MVAVELHVILEHFVRIFNASTFVGALLFTCTTQKEALRNRKLWIFLILKNYVIRISISLLPSKNIGIKITLFLYPELSYEFADLDSKCWSNC